MSLPQNSAADDALLVGEARAILSVAAQKGELDGARARAFARACLERDLVGRLALAVLDGGVFAPARLVELAAIVAEPNVDGDAPPSTDGQSILHSTKRK